MALDDALKALAVVDRKGQAVESRFFGGLSVDETAEVFYLTRFCAIRNEPKFGW